MRKSLSGLFGAWPVLALSLFIAWEPHAWLFWSALGSFVLWLLLSRSAVYYLLGALLGLSLGLDD